MKYLLILIVAMLSFVSLKAQDTRAFYIGHSLSDQIPDMVASLSQNHSEVSFNNWVYQSIPGAPLRWQWQRKDAQDYNPIHPFHYGFYHNQYGLKSGEFDVLVLTESVPRHWTEWGINETYQYADSFLVYARNYNRDIKIYLYEDWHCIKSGTPTGCDYDIDSNPWRQRLDDDLPMWESVVDTLNSRYPSENPVCLIPAAYGLGKLSDAIDAGAVAGLSSYEDLFSDDIHLNDIGKYFVACVHFSMLHNKSPLGLTNKLNNMWGNPFDAPTPEQARIFQEIAWQTANEYPKTCLKNDINAVAEVLKNHNDIYLFPNPGAGQISLQIDDFDTEIIIYDYQMKEILKTRGSVFDSNKLPIGIYFVKIANKFLKFTKY